MTASTDSADKITETTPPDSETGSDAAEPDDGKPALGKAAHSRANSVKTTHSTYSTMSSTGKPRTYFTHTGRVTVSSDAPPPSGQEGHGDTKPADAVSVSGKSAKSDRKSRRFSLFSSKKSKAVVAN